MKTEQTRRKERIVPNFARELEEAKKMNEKVMIEFDEYRKKNARIIEGMRKDLAKEKFDAKNQLDLLEDELLKATL